MGRIQVLTERVANQIAAGEVVERPASVCKELVENALDAGATRIGIELRGGGRGLIKITDNGCGMNRDDAMLAFERHATSKLRKAEDLLAIATLGFRGEALPSIASVSRVRLKTKAAGEDSGTVVEIHGGRLRDVSDASLARGTSVTVRNLFYNVPARRKFLRTERTELSHVVRIATQYSLAHLDKCLSLRHARGTLLSVTPVSSLRERVYQVFGGDTLDRLVELETARVGNLELAGFVSEPQAQRPNRNALYTFVNRRLVRDALMQRAVSKAYENLMPKGAFPFALLFLDLPPAEVDVNVHPAKTEVRFRRPGQVFEFVRGTIRDRLIAAKPASGLPPPLQSAHQMSAPGPAPSGPLRRSLGGIRSQSPGMSLNLTEPRQAGSRLPSGEPHPARPPGAGIAASAPSEPPSDAMTTEAPHSRAPLVDRSPANLGNLGDLRLLGQLHDSFIVAAGDDGVWIIDQHVAHERILFEKVLAARLHGKPRVQRLLAPIVLTLEPHRMIAYEALADEFRGNGFEIDPFGARTIAIKAAPAELSHRQVESLIRDLLDDRRDAGQGLTLGGLRKRMAATIACHAAIKINMPLPDEKMRWLLEELARTECPMSCPHGRPIALRYGTRDILKAFHRL